MWEVDMILNEFLTPYVVIGYSYISNMTAAYLKDTGWFTYVNDEFVEDSLYGKNKGCTFYNTVIEKYVANQT